MYIVDILLQTRLILWRGQKHSGKTTAAGRLIEQARKEGFNVAGLLAPAVYSGGRLLGFDLINLRTGGRVALAETKKTNSGNGPFNLEDAGLRFGAEALKPDKVKEAELIIIDEFGPLELAGGGWRRNVDSLLRSTGALILLVVRDELVETVENIYQDIPAGVLAALEPSSTAEVVQMLIHIRQQSQ